MPIASGSDLFQNKKFSQNFDLISYDYWDCCDAWSHAFHFQAFLVILRGDKKTDKPMKMTNSV